VSADDAIARLLELEAKKYKHLSARGGLNLQGLVARINALEQELETAHTHSDSSNNNDGSDGEIDVDNVVVDLSDTNNGVEHSNLDVKTNRPTFSQRLHAANSTPSSSHKPRPPHPAIQKSASTTTIEKKMVNSPHPLSTTHMQTPNTDTPTARRHKTASLPHGFTLNRDAVLEGAGVSSLPAHAVGGRPTSVMISSKSQQQALQQQALTQMHPLARANNYNAGSNEVFQPFMYKQKRRPSVNSVAISNPGAIFAQTTPTNSGAYSARPNFFGGATDNNASSSSNNSVNGSSLASVSEDPAHNRWVKG
jgi:hypothetical protein